MKKNPKVSIIILNWNGWRKTVECLESLTKINYSNYEVIIVDNGSTDESVDRLKRLRKIKLILNKRNLGFSGGNNTAIRKILKEDRSKFILLLNNDTIVEKNFLNELIKAAQAEEKAGILGPKIYYFDYQDKKNVIQSAGSKINLCLGKFPSVEKLNQVDDGRFKQVKDVDFVIGACLLIKTEVIRKIGLLDKRYFLLFEDTDWCLRAKKAGYSILYVPQSIIWHRTSQSMRRVSEVYYYTRNLFWFEFKYANPFQLLCFLLNYFIFIFPKYFFGYILIKRDYRLWKNYTHGVIAGLFKR